MTKYILGGGLSGLVAAYYNPEYTLVTPELGGFIDSKFGRAFVVLHATDGMRDLFRDLGVRSFEKRIELAYYDHDWSDAGVSTSFDSEMTEKTFARRYIEEKLPERFQPGKDLELSAPGDSWEALFVDSSIVSALADEVRNRRFGWVKDVSDDVITLQPETGSTEELEYEHVVSTLPATLFRKVADVSWDLDFVPTTYGELPREKVPERYLEKPWNVLYTVDPSVEYHRVVRNMLSSRYYVECLGDVDVYGATDQATNQNGVIQNADLTPPNDRITFLGRYAEWQHERRIDHVIEKAREGL